MYDTDTKIRSNQIAYILIIIMTMILTVNIIPTCSQAKTKKPKWKKEITSLTVGKTYRYRITGCSKKSIIRFSSNHKSLASIHPKTGLLRAKKKGSIIITAKIKEPHRKVKKIKTKLKITTKKKNTTHSSKNNSNLAKNNTSSVSSDLQTKTKTSHSTILDHVQFTVSKSINPWNHTLLLYSNRILLQSEVQNSTLTLSHSLSESNSNYANHLIANFVSLSGDGKTLIYQLSDASAQKICPGNGTQNGNYNITSTLFSDTLSSYYQECISSNSISGFAITSNSSTLANVSVSLYSNRSHMLLASTKTDQNGYYQFQNITTEDVTLTAQLENYDTFSTSIENLTGYPLCQNIIMHPFSINDLALSCQIVDTDEQPIKDATVIIINADQELISRGKVNTNGMITFANEISNSSKGYTLINYQNNNSIPFYYSENMPSSDNIITAENPLFSRNQEYSIYVIPTDEESNIPTEYHMASFSFSFASLLSEQLFLQVHLQDLPVLSIDKLSVNTDSLEENYSYFDLTLYSKDAISIFQTQLMPSAQISNNDFSKQLSLEFQNSSLRFHDGEYYIALTAYSYADQPISGTEILPVSIQNGMIRSLEFTLKPVIVSHSIIYANFSCDTTDPLSFYLYQQSNSLWFPIGIFSSDIFTTITTTTSKSYIDFPLLQENMTYCLVPDDSSYSITSGFLLQTTSEQEDDVTNSIPDHQIIIAKTSTDDKTKDYLNQNCNLIDYISFCTFHQTFDDTFFSSSYSYPNTIYAYYQTDGTFLNIFLATPAFLQSNTTSSSDQIYYCLHNRDIIYTSQPSYRFTPFFVT